MNFVRASFVLALVVVSACSNNNAGRWASDGADGANGYAQGSASDPASPAYFQQTVGDRVYFTVDQSAIDDSARVVLAAQADWLAQNPAYKVTIEGHADEQGTREYNLAVGARRDNAAREHSVPMGVSA